MAVSEDVVAVLAAKFAVMRKIADERTWRVYLGTEARALGRGGIKAVAVAAGASESMVAAGVEEIESGGVDDLPRGRSRRPGGGRKKAEDTQPGLTQQLKSLVEEATRGDPVAEIIWCSLSLRELERRLALAGFRCGKDAIARMMREDGYSLQAMAKVVEGKKQHPDRDAQFGYVSAKIAEYQAAGEPVVSVDGKKEMLGLYGRDGRAWRPKGEPVRVRDHDFADKDTVRISPYGVYDIAANRGFVSAGTSHDTAAFAVNALRLWWQREGSLRYPGAGKLLMICDAGGSSSCAGRLWKHELALLRDQTGLEITVMHFPPGTSKWNKIEHRLFCHITRTWRARPLMTISDAVAGIAATVTSQGLKCTAVTDDGVYPKGIEVSNARMKHIEDCDLDRDSFHGEWNYTFRAVPRPAPGPEPRPGPAGPDPVLLQALAGIPGPQDLLKEIAPAWNAGREYRLALDRGRERLRHRGKAYRKLSDEALLAAAACRIRLGMTWALLGRLLGVHPASISVLARWAVPVLEEHGITAQPGSPRITTDGRLLQLAAAAGITITIPGPDQQNDRHASSHRPQHARS
jgi:hypothetical protein